jgi:hypothetical protein
LGVSLQLFQSFIYPYVPVPWRSGWIEETDLLKTDLLIMQQNRRVHDGVGEPDLAGDGREAVSSSIRLGGSGRNYRLSLSFHLSRCLGSFWSSSDGSRRVRITCIPFVDREIDIFLLHVHDTFATGSVGSIVLCFFSSRRR